MATLVAIGYPDQGTAEQARGTVARLESELVIQADQVATLRPLAFGIVVVLCTIMIHALALAATVNFVRREQRIGHLGGSFGINLAIVAVAILIAFAAHLIEIAVWAGLFVIYFPDGVVDGRPVRFVVSPEDWTRIQARGGRIVRGVEPQ